MDNADGFTCCQDNLLLDEELVVADSIFDEPGDEDESVHSSDVSDATERVVRSYFERGDPDEVVIDLETLYATMAEDTCHDFIRTPPPTFNIGKLLNEMKVDDTISSYAEAKNKELLHLLDLNNQTELLGKILWSCGCQIVIEESLLNMDELLISSQGWTAHSRELYLLITRSRDFMRDLQFFFGTSQVSRTQSAIGAELMMEVYKEVAAAAVQKVRREETLAPVPFNVREMSMEGLAKVRYVGAWVFAKF